MSSVVRAAHAVVVAILVSGCGYALAGKVNNVPDYVKRIGIPAFQNHTSTSELDRIFTDAVTAEFQSRGKFTIVPSATGVDAVLTGTIQSVELVPTGAVVAPGPTATLPAATAPASTPVAIAPAAVAPAAVAAPPAAQPPVSQAQ